MELKGMGQSESNKKFYYKVTYLSFMMAIIIVYCHSIGIEAYPMPTVLYWIELFVFHLTDTIVPCFFFLSGFLFFMNLNSKQDLKRKWKSRLKSLVVPYIIWSFAGFLYFSLVVCFAGNYVNMEIPQFELLRFLNDVFIDTKYNITWFLRNLICYTYLIPLMWLFTKKPYFLFIMGGGGMVIGYIFHSSLLLYSIFYIAGGGLSSMGLGKNTYTKSVKLFAFFFLTFTLFLETSLEVLPGPHLAPLRLFQVLSIWIVADVLRHGRPPKWWMTISMFIYCSHSMILESIEKGFLLLTGRTATGAILDFLFAPILTLTIIYLGAIILRKCPVVWNIITGNRNYYHS